MKELGIKAAQFNELKVVAIENEDYMSAKKLKEEIDRLKRTVLDISVDIFRKSVSHTSELRSHISERTAQLEAAKNS